MGQASIAMINHQRVPLLWNSVTFLYVSILPRTMASSFWRAVTWAATLVTETGWKFGNCLCPFCYPSISLEWKWPGTLEPLEFIDVRQPDDQVQNAFATDSFLVFLRVQFLVRWNLSIDLKGVSVRISEEVPHQIHKMYIDNIDILLWHSAFFVVDFLWRLQQGGSLFAFAGASLELEKTDLKRLVGRIECI
jgi:hypothetical protein